LIDEMGDLNLKPQEHHLNALRCLPESQRNALTWLPPHPKAWFKEGKEHRRSHQKKHSRYLNHLGF
jgi:hypothetical protein